MPTDFLADNTQPIKDLGQNSPRDFLAEETQPQESFIQSAMYAPFRIGEDVAKSAYQFGQNIPGYIQSAQTEIPGLVSAFKNNPLHAVGQAFAGGNEMINNLAQFPANISQYLSSGRLNLLPQNVANAIKNFGPEDTGKDINKLFGQPTQPGENLLRGVFRNLNIAIPGSLALKSLAELPINALRKIDPELISKSIQKSHDQLLNSAEDKFNKVGMEASRRNVDQIPIRNDLISDIADNPVFPNTKKTQAILDQAHSGDYQGLRDLQSELFHRSNKAQKSAMISDLLAGEKLADLRSEINDSITNHFNQTGNPDLANQLNDARNQYRILKDTYFNKLTPKAIRDLVGENRKMPNDIINTLSERSKAMDKVKSLNPYAATKLEQLSTKQNALNTLKKLGYASVALAGVPSGLKVYNAYKNIVGKE